MSLKSKGLKTQVIPSDTEGKVVVVKEAFKAHSKVQIGSL